MKNFMVGDTEVDIVGFSRGAAAAREFAWHDYEHGIRLDDGTLVRPKIRFLGLFDTVYSMGLPGNDVDLGYANALPPNVENVRHAVAQDERRFGFELTSTCPEASCQDSNMVEKTFAGAHSDVGGGYKDNLASFRALRWMWSEARWLGVPFHALPSDFATDSGEHPLVHDSSSDHELVTEEELASRSAKRGPRKVYYPRPPG